MPDEDLDGKEEGPLEWKPVRDCLDPARHELQGDEPAGEQKLGHDVRLEKMALPRVVQNVTVPSSQRFMVRIRYAPTIAGKNTTTPSGVRSKVGLKTSVSPTAIGR